MMIAVFDLDGTLANIEHRLHHLVNKKWDSFYDACNDDIVIDPVRAVALSLYHGGHRIEVWSGRSDRVRAQTERWLDKHDIHFHILRMRCEGDHRPDHAVKGEWFDGLDLRARPAIVFEDRNSVVQMWRARGILCCQVAPGEF